MTNYYIDYNKVFDVAYSYTLSEDVKISVLNQVLDKVGEELNESLNEPSSHCVEFINRIMNTSLSEEVIGSLLDYTFGELSEEEIDEITEEFKEYYAKQALATIHEWDPAPVGLKGVERANKAQQDKANKPSAMDRLKGAVNKVKAWAKDKRPVGLSGVDGLKKQRDERIKTAVEMGTGPKAETKTTQAAQPSQPKPKRASTKLTDAEKAEMEATGDKKFEEMKAREAEANKRRQESRKATLNAKKEAAKTPEQREAERDAEVEKRFAEMKAREAEANKRRQESRKATMERKKAEAENKQNVSNASNAVSDAIKNAENPEQNKETVPVRGRRGRRANEALDEFYSLLEKTNISEKALAGVKGLLINKDLAQKALNKEYNTFMADMKPVDQAVNIEGHTGIKNSKLSDYIKKAQKSGNNYERLLAFAKKRYGN